ncbi:uncharacterized protein TNCV_5049751 [Trichonephila clavipes]|nr:uncharacterized protein TNCV_5049751 [Trichonephila clavipes]
MPHHGVYRPEKSTTKMRTVFNASSPSTSGKSLNSIQFNGGLVQEDLFSIMVRFRKHKIEQQRPTSFTKRMVLSTIARIFDPLGLLGPIITWAKIFMQRLWLLELGWSDELPFKKNKRSGVDLSTL